jgi:hypothetical protein
MTHIYSQFGYALTEWYSNWSKDMEYKIITVNHYCQPHRIEYNQFRIETLTVFKIEIPETACV